MLKPLLACLFAVSLFSISSTALAVSPTEIEAGVNGVRASRGLPLLSDNPILDNSAAEKGGWLCRTNQWGHFNWIDWIANAGYSNYINAGENLAYGYSDTAGLINAWVMSPEHMANIGGDYNEQGAAVIECPNYQGRPLVDIAINHFGKRWTAPPATTLAPKLSVTPEVQALTLPKPAETGSVKPRPHHHEHKHKYLTIYQLLMLSLRPPCWHPFCEIVSG